MTSTFVCEQTRRSCRTCGRRVMWTRDPLRIPPMIAQDNGTEPSCCLPTDLQSVWIWEAESKRFRQTQTGLGRSNAAFTALKHSSLSTVLLIHYTVLVLLVPILKKQNTCAEEECNVNLYTGSSITQGRRLLVFFRFTQKPLNSS